MHQDLKPDRNHSSTYFLTNHKLLSQHGEYQIFPTSIMEKNQLISNNKEVIWDISKFSQAIVIHLPGGKTFAKTYNPFPAVSIELVLLSVK